MASDLDNNGLLTFGELKTLYHLLCNQNEIDYGWSNQEIRALFNEYAEFHKDTPGGAGLKTRGISLDKFEDLCLDKGLFTIK